MSIENTIVYIIIGMAAIYVFKRLFRHFKKQQKCDCTCSSCDASIDCIEKSSEDYNRANFNS